MYETGWARGGINSLSYAFTDFHSDEAANATGAEFTREQIRRIVREGFIVGLTSVGSGVFFGRRFRCWQKNGHAADLLIERARTDGDAQADLAGALGDRDEHDVHDPDAADHQGNHRHAKQQLHGEVGRDQPAALTALDGWEGEGFRVVAHDRRGHGRSSQPWNGNEMDTYADDLAALGAATSDRQPSDRRTAPDGARISPPQAHAQT